QADSVTLDSFRQFVANLGEVHDVTDKFATHVGSMDDDVKGLDAMKLGVCELILCRYAKAIESFKASTDNKERQYFLGLCYQGQRDFAAAADAFDKALVKGLVEAAPRQIETLAFSGDLAGAAKALKVAKLDGTADGAYLDGLLAELDRDVDKAVACYDAAREIQPSHPEATFRLAYNLDLYGDDEEAISLYYESVEQRPVYSEALLNLAILLEDAGQNEDALHLLTQVLTANPNHVRAKLYFRDVESSDDMYYDEDQARRVAKRNAVLDIPVTDFELSVRARNCLRKMNILSLGDLVRTTEAELLGYKNFGETSLKEIKEILSAKGLRLGQALEEDSELGLSPAPMTLPEGVDEGIAATPISQIEFSVRARRVLEQLNCATIGELAQKSEAELMSMKNFGQTSLNEMRDRLADYGMKFRDSV
ncbi:MAG: tetratricopeptide repeat protein, partial [Phycisphaerales bacterium]|nr:tetratricopeptide repeat protein [Phycisphaerales bacterium]